MGEITYVSLLNRRRTPRRKPRGFVKVKCRKGSMGLGPNLAIALLDVSMGGARLVLSQELAIQHEIEVELEVYGLTRPMRRLANVRWQIRLDNGTFCTGVEFDRQLAYADWLHIVVPS